MDRASDGAKRCVPVWISFARRHEPSDGEMDLIAGPDLSRRLRGRRCVIDEDDDADGSWSNAVRASEGS